MRFLLILLVLTVSGFCIASVKQADNNATKATVYIYSPHHVKTLGRVARPVFVDEHEIAQLDGGRYFIMHLTPGVHEFRSKKGYAGVRIDMAGGQIYYLKMELENTGFTLKNPHITLAPVEQGSYDVQQMKKIKRSDVRDGSQVDPGSIEERH